MTDDLVKRLRDRGTSEINCLCGNPMCVEAADRIELLEELVSYLAGTNKDHVRVMLAGNPIVCDEIISKARAAFIMGSEDE